MYLFIVIGHLKLKLKWQHLGALVSGGDKNTNVYKITCGMHLKSLVSRGLWQL